MNKQIRKAQKASARKLKVNRKRRFERIKQKLEREREEAERAALLLHELAHR
jgi:hypothetical protein